MAYVFKLQAIEEILNGKPSTCLLSVCDQTAVNKLMLAKAHFLVKLASTINDIPQVVEKSDGFVTGEGTKYQGKVLNIFYLGRNLFFAEEGM